MFYVTSFLFTMIHPILISMDMVFDNVTIHGWFGWDWQKYAIWSLS